MIQQSQKAGAKVLLLGMGLPPNYGLRYDKPNSVASRIGWQHGLFTAHPDPQIDLPQALKKRMSWSRM